MDNSLINFFYEKGQEAISGHQPDFHSPTELASYFETGKDGEKNDNINCVSSLKVKYTLRKKTNDKTKDDSTIQVPLVRTVEPTKMKTDHHQIVTDMFSKQMESLQAELQAELESLFG